MAEVTNIYNSVDSQTKTLIIKPGEKVILPSNIIIDSLVLDGSINVESSCDNLPEPSEYKCGYFALVVDSDDNSGHSMDEAAVYIQSIKVGNNLYNINRKVISSGDNAGTLQTAEVLNTHVPDQVIFTFTRIQRDTSPDKRQYVYVYFKAPEDLYSSIEMKVSNWETIQYYRPYEAECDTYEFGVDIDIFDII